MSSRTSHSEAGANIACEDEVKKNLVDNNIEVKWIFLKFTWTSCSWVTKVLEPRLAFLVARERNFKAALAIVTPRKSSGE